jgi:DNA-binding MarR family transcriptional regulator
LSHTVRRLEGSGWVARETCPTDRRGAFAVLTDEGLAVLEQAAPGHVRGVRRHLFDQLSPAQLDALGAVGHALVEHLATTRADSEGPDH